MTQLNYLTSGPADGTAATQGNMGSTTGTNTGTGGTQIWKSAYGRGGRTGVQMVTTTSGQANAIRFPFAASNAQVQATWAQWTPAASLAAQFQLASFRYATGRNFSIVQETNNNIRCLDNANNPTMLCASGSYSASTLYVFGAVADRTAASYTVHMYTTAGTLIGTAQVNSGASFTANDFSHLDIGGGTAIGTTGVIDVQMNDGAGSEIADYVPSTPLATPVVTAGAATQPSSSTATDGTQTYTWPAVANASTYDARLATKASPTEADFVTIATGVSSPYTATGLGAGTYAVGVRANP